MNIGCSNINIKFAKSFYQYQRVRLQTIYDITKAFSCRMHRKKCDEPCYNDYVIARFKCTTLKAIIPDYGPKTHAQRTPVNNGATLAQSTLGLAAAAAS